MLFLKGPYMNKKNIIFSTLLGIFLFILSSGCTSDKSDAKNLPSKSLPTKSLNIIVILDTSDRVSKVKNPRQTEKDIMIGKAIVNLFEDFARQQLYVGSRHRLAFVVPEQPGVDPIPQKIIENLKIWPQDRDRSAGAPRFREMKTKLLTAINELYESVNKQVKFTGSDIWKWFRDSAEVYLKPNTLNYIICLSDGYLDFNSDIQAGRTKKRNKANYIPYRQVVKFRNNPDWRQKFHAEGHGLLGIGKGKDFGDYNVKFLMVEISHRHMLDLEIVKEYWQTWLKSMGITDSQFLPTQDDPQVVIDEITTFISAQ